MKEFFISIKNKSTIVATSSLIVAFSAVNCFAAEGDVATSISTSLMPIKTDSLATLVAVAPIGIAIGGAYLVWKYGWRFFKGLAK
ncbi:TPA: hypothetical protein KNJ60_003880 [Clostridioides difficile]|nr:hypothetical protein [Clostridioides difficile]